MESRKAQLFKVLGVETRIKIIELLKERGPMGANEMSEILGVTPSAVSQHLKILKHAGLVSDERKGYWIPYDIDPAALEKCGELLSTVCTCGCPGTGRSQEATLDKTSEELALLKRYELELQEELNKIRARIEELSK